KRRLHKDKWKATAAPLRAPSQAAVPTGRESGNRRRSGAIRLPPSKVELTTEAGDVFPALEQTYRLRKGKWDPAAIAPFRVLAPFQMVIHKRLHGLSLAGAYSRPSLHPNLGRGTPPASRAVRAGGAIPDAPTTVLR